MQPRRQEEEYLQSFQNPTYNTTMSGPYGQPGYNPQYQNPYPAGGPPPPGWGQGQQQQGFMPPPMPHPTMMGMGGNPAYAESGEPDKYNLQFSDRTIRAAFVRKVFFMVAIMLGVVAIMTAIPFMNNDTRLFVARNLGMYWAAYGIFFAVYLALMCCESVRRSFPANIILTAVFTLAVGYMTMMITAHHDIVSVLLTLIICSICCGSIIIFSMQTKYDLTNMMGIVFILSMCLMVFGLVAIISAIFFKVKFIYMVYAALASLLFMFYLAIDVQLLMGGRKYEISPEDHIFAAVQIFLDIVYIFWMLLSLFGSSNN
uniref:Protein lifeguard 1-like n=1 Tax=Haemonchus contortus TaxID=6289 RepID=A0A7I4YST4_HAECO